LTSNAAGNVQIKEKETACLVLFYPAATLGGNDMTLFVACVLLMFLVAAWLAGSDRR
jgi:hypothetical protein